MRNSFVNTIIEACLSREDIFVLSGDAGLGVFDDFKNTNPRQFLNMGIAEQNMTGFGAGLALTGFKVYLYNIIPFLLYRCYEQVRNDICYQRLPIVMVGIGSGITYAFQGMTHYSVEDIGIAATLANLTVISPMDPIEAFAAAKYSLTALNPVYVRLAKRNETCFHTDKNIDITKPIKISNGEDLAIIFHGSISNEVILAAELLRKSKINPILISTPMIQPFDFNGLLEILEKVKYVFTVEEHFISCGLGAKLSRWYSRNKQNWQLFNLGIEDQFIHQVKDTANLRDEFGISAQKIFEFISAKISKGR